MIPSHASLPLPSIQAALNAVDMEYAVAGTCRYCCGKVSIDGSVRAVDGSLSHHGCYEKWLARTLIELGFK